MDFSRKHEVCSVGFLLQDSSRFTQECFTTNLSGTIHRDQTETQRRFGGFWSFPQSLSVFLSRFLKTLSRVVKAGSVLWEQQSSSRHLYFTSLVGQSSDFSLSIISWWTQWSCCHLLEDRQHWLAVSLRTNRKWLQSFPPKDQDVHHVRLNVSCRGRMLDSMIPADYYLVTLLELFVCCWFWLLFLIRVIWN